LLGSRSITMLFFIKNLIKKMITATTNATPDRANPTISHVSKPFLPARMLPTTIPMSPSAPKSIKKARRTLLADSFYSRSS